MIYGALAPKQLPQQDAQKLLLLLERWARGAEAKQKWADKAKECVDFVEGRHWDQDTLRKMSLLGRPALTINKTNRLVRLMMGYFSNNRTDIKYLAGHDGTGVEDTAKALTAIGKQISKINHLPYLDTEVFMDGIITGRGFYDHRLSFDDNDLGVAKYRAVDPFSLTIDPDTNTYDLNESASYLVEDRWASLDEVEVYYGKAAREQVEPFAYGATPVGQFLPSTLAEETTPIRRFAYSTDNGSDWWDNLYSKLGMFVDPLRKTLRVMDFQYKVLTPTRVFVDLQTGDRKEIPEDWSRDRIARVLYWCKESGWPIAATVRPMRKIRWSTVIGDLMVYDDWSPYSSYSITGFFPYFRRGVTRGMVEDLIEPNKEINKRRSARIDAIMRIPHSGWMYHKSSLDEVQKMRLKHYGSEAGFELEWQGDPGMKPEKIQASVPPSGLQELEKAGADDLHEVSGINESALGELDIGQSGKAIEARQRQAVIAVQMYMTNMSRTKNLQGVKQLELIQEHYTEARTFRILGTDGQPQTYQINAPSGTPGELLNNVMLGTYDVEVSDRPLAASFEAAQFEELMQLMEKLGPVGVRLMQIAPELIIDASTLDRKEDFKKALKQAAAAPAPQAAPLTDEEKRLKQAEAFAAFGSGAASLAKAATTVQQGEAELAAYENAAANGGAQPGAAPGGPPAPGPAPVNGGALPAPPAAGAPGNVVALR